MTVYGFSMEWGVCEDDTQFATCETSLEMRSTLARRFIPATSNPSTCSFVARWSLYVYFSLLFVAPGWKPASWWYGWMGSDELEATWIAVGGAEEEDVS
jgi:hypothetical protein